MSTSRKRKLGLFPSGFFNQPSKSIRIPETLEDKFVQGDLVFGLYRPRDEVIKALQNKGFHHVFANALNEKVVRMVVQGTTEAKITALCPEQRKHYYFLLKHRDYLLRQPGKTIPEMPHDIVVGAAFRRACKLLAIHPEEGRVSRIHFLTTGFNIDRGFEKKDSKGSVTASEVRAIFREELRKKQENPNVLFYNEKLEVLSDRPWKKSKAAEAYAEHVRKKDEAKLTNQKTR